jgi:RNA polymerase sigma factor (sigma-70 family)
VPPAAPPAAPRTASAAELFRSSLPLVEHIARGLCRRAGLQGADAEDFASAAKLALVEDDYAVLRAFAGRSSLATYLTVVLRRLLADERMRALGRWHPSAAAARLGAAGVRLETLVRRAGRSVEEALPLVRAFDPALTRERAEALVASFPPRAPRLRLVATTGLDLPGTAESAEAQAVAGETRRLAARTSRVMRRALASFEAEDRAIVRLRFGSALSIADISRLLRLPQRPLYRRLEALLLRLRTALAAAGIGAGNLAELIGEAGGDMDFGLAHEETTCRWRTTTASPDPGRGR